MKTQPDGLTRRALIGSGAAAGALAASGLGIGFERSIDAVTTDPEERITQARDKFIKKFSRIKRNNERWDGNIIDFISDHPQIELLKTENIHAFLHSYWVHTESVREKGRSIPTPVRLELARIVPGIAAEESAYDYTSSQNNGANGLMRIKTTTAKGLDPKYQWNKGPKENDYKNVPVSAEVAFANFERVYTHITNEFDFHKTLSTQSKLSKSKIDQFTAFVLAGAHNSGEGLMRNLLINFFKSDHSESSPIELFNAMVNWGRSKQPNWTAENSNFVFRSLAAAEVLDPERYGLSAKSLSSQIINSAADIASLAALGIAGAIAGEAATKTALDRNPATSPKSASKLKIFLKHVADRCKSVITPPPHDPRRRNLILGGTAAAIAGVAGGLTIENLLTLDEEAASGKENAITNRYRVENNFMSISPNKNQGALALLESLGLDSKQALGHFQSLNDEKLDHLMTLKGNNFYQAPIFTLEISEGKNLWRVLKNAGVHRYLERIHKYNQEYNPEYFVSNSSEIYPGQMVMIPQWGTGFYETTSEAPLFPTPAENSGTESDINPNKDIKTPEFEMLPNSTEPYLLLKQKLQKEKKRSNDLAGYTFVLDPGHGGQDPGALGTEAALAYDCTLRLMRYIILHGGEVDLTHYNTQAGIQDTKILKTDQKKQIYNLTGGGQVKSRNTDTRKEITKKLLSKAGKSNSKKTIFLSLHADSLRKNLDQGITFTTDRDRDNNKDTNKADLAFAKKLASHIPRAGVKKRPRYIKYANGRKVGGGLGILHSNPAQRQLLVELVNLQNKNGSWRIRSHKNREKMAQLIGKSLRKTLKS